MTPLGLQAIVEAPDHGMWPSNEERRVLTYKSNEAA